MPSAIGRCSIATTCHRSRPEAGTFEWHGMVPCVAQRLRASDGLTLKGPGSQRLGIRRK
jgi:hypothetical protein